MTLISLCDRYHVACPCLFTRGLASNKGLETLWEFPNSISFFTAIYFSASTTGSHRLLSAESRYTRLHYTLAQPAHQVSCEMVGKSQETRFPIYGECTNGNPSRFFHLQISLLQILFAYPLTTPAFTCVSSTFPCIPLFFAMKTTHVMNQNVKKRDRAQNPILGSAIR